MSKALRDFVDLLHDTFQEGTCVCMRCESGEDQEKYRYQHTFEIDGFTYHRQFSKSGKDDLSSKTSALLKHHYKDEKIDLLAPCPESKISDLIDEKEYSFFTTLGLQNGLIEKIENGNLAFNT